MSRFIDADFEEKHYTSMLLNPTPDVTRHEQWKAKVIVEALQMAKTVDVYANLKMQIKTLKSKITSINRDYYTGYMSALSVVEGMIATIEQEGGQNGTC